MIAYGKITTWIDDRGFGFLRPDSREPDVFIHYTALLSSGLPANLRPGQRAKVEYEMGRKGPHAVHVELLDDS